ncbi:Uncharacterised protein [Mycobacterium tuberculosis]|nr:Uncharacterised protein [Mycobacterium tuberculosis]
MVVATSTPFSPAITTSGTALPSNRRPAAAAELVMTIGGCEGSANSDGGNLPDCDTTAMGGGSSSAQRSHRSER